MKRKKKQTWLYNVWRAIALSQRKCTPKCDGHSKILSPFKLACHIIHIFKLRNLWTLYFMYKLCLKSRWSFADAYVCGMCCGNGDSSICIHCTRIRVLGLEPFRWVDIEAHTHTHSQTPDNWFLCECVLLWLKSTRISLSLPLSGFFSSCFCWYQSKLMSVKSVARINWT